MARGSNKSKRKKIDLTQERLMHLLSYSPEQGVFTRIRDAGSAREGSIAGGNTASGYIQMWVDGNNYTAHRLAFLYMTGRFPEGHVDHINHDRSDNSWENLRSASRLENNRNQTMHKTNTSGYVGVSLDRKRGKWRAWIRIDGKNTCLGSYDCAEAAGAAAKAARMHEGYHENHGTQRSQINE